MEEVIDEEVCVAVHVVGDQDSRKRGGGGGGGGGGEGGGGSERRGMIRRWDEVFGELSEWGKHDVGMKFAPIGVSF